MSNVFALDQHHVEVGLKLLQKISRPESGIASAHDRDVRGGVGLKWGLRGVALKAVPPQGRTGRLLGV